MMPEGHIRPAARLGFLPGAGIGALVAVLAMLIVDPAVGAADRDALGAWVALNLGHSSWLFGAVLLVFVLHLARLERLLRAGAGPRRVVALDQLTDVWIHLFIGIGVVWTAVGMRSALQVALADTDQALADSAGSVLQKLVDGGILLALSTTIVGAVGGYVMRLGKTMRLGADLHDFYDGLQRAELRELLAAVQRLEGRLDRHPVGERADAAG